MMKTITFIIAIIVLLLTGCRNTAPKTSSPEIAIVRVTEIAPETISIPVHSTGILESSEEMKLSFKTGGIIEKIQIQEGDRVKRGDILATLNLSEINAQVDLAGNGFEKATRDYTRAKNLYADSVATLEQLQNASTAVSAAKSNLEIAQFNLKHSQITAPDNGIVLKQFARSNELIASGYPVFLFGTSGKKWKVRAGLADRDFVRINPGDSASVTLDAWPGIRFPAVVDQVGEMSNPLTGTYDIELTLNTTSYRLATGFVAGVEIYPSKKESFIMVPVGAIIEADGQSGYVFSVDKSMTVQKTKTEIVTIIGSRAALKGNLNGTKQIVSEGAAYLRDGEKVKVVK
jgi:membrane fusion protein, multidrug efflux system